MTENPQHQDYIDKRVERALMFRALRRIRGIVDNMEAADARNRIIAIVITMVGISLFIALLYVFVSRHDPSNIESIGNVSSLMRSLILT